MPEINKSTRHSKITGDFAESLVLYWLSKHGFECASVDHTGIDLIARNPVTLKLMGISVKSRSRNTGKEKTHLNIPKDNFIKADKACKAFGCVLYFAILIDRGDTITIYILNKRKLLKMFPGGQSVSVWKMSDLYLERYRKDKRIVKIEFKHNTNHWWIER